MMRAADIHIRKALRLLMGLPGYNPNDYVYAPVADGGLGYTFEFRGDCTFVLEGPPGSQLDLKVHSFSSSEPTKNLCKEQPIQIFTYKKNKLSQSKKVLCAEEDTVRMISETNTVVLTSTVRHGSFFVRVRPLLSSSLVSSQPTDSTNKLTSQRRTDVIERRQNDLSRFEEDYFARLNSFRRDFSKQVEIEGMVPPNVQSIDFFATMNQFEIPSHFRAQPQGFLPSLHYPGDGVPRPTDSYGVPVTALPTPWGPYPGNPRPEISITSTQGPVEWVTSRPGYTTPSHGTSSTTPGRYPSSAEHNFAVTAGPPLSVPTTASPGTTKFSEPLSTTNEYTTTVAAPTLATPPGKITEIGPANTTVSTETELIEDEDARKKRYVIKNGGFRPMISLS